MERPPVLLFVLTFLGVGFLAMAVVLGWGHAERGRLQAVPPPVSPIAAPALPSSPPLMYNWPVLAPISSYYGPRSGRMHSGIDLAANQGDPVRAAREGKVLVAGTLPGYGLTVILTHPDGSRTLYAHNSRLLVHSGQLVHRGDLLALVGSTGISTGPHLHFEVIINDRPRDPLLYLPANRYVKEPRDALANH